MSKADGPSLISRNLFVAWSRDSVHKSIHYLNTEVQGSSTSWLDQACKWCMHFPVQTHKTDIQHPQNLIKILKIMKTKVSGRPNGHWFAGHFSVDLWGRFLFFPNHVLCLNIWWYQEKNNPLLLVGQQLCHLGSLNVRTITCPKNKEPRQVSWFHIFRWIYDRICELLDG